jgi:hypothetical protein
VMVDYEKGGTVAITEELRKRLDRLRVG